MSERRQDTLVVKNKTGTAYSLVRYGVILRPDQEIDLVSHSGRPTAELRKDADLSREIEYGHLCVVSEYDSLAESLSVAEKIDQLLGIVKGIGAPAPQTPAESQKIDLSSVERLIDEKLSGLAKREGAAQEAKPEGVDEEALRRQAMEQLVSRKRDIKTNLEGFGKEQKSVRSEDNSGLIDF